MHSQFKFLVLSALIIITIGFQACHEVGINTTTPRAITTASVSNEWNDYWYAGKGEINSYKLEQSRYGQNREGTSVLVFVTEDFSKSKQVKLDNPSRNPGDKVSVLKANMIRKFNTGIYDYSMMASVFTPVSSDKYPHTLKVTTSSQEWCGHTWTQYNRTNGGYNIEGKSYFESEGDATSKLNVDWLEDELWNRIRINPSNVPTGKLKITPGSFFTRLDHVAFSIEDAVLEKKQTADETTFLLQYQSIDRSLAITIENAAPHKIISWEEKTRRGSTKATLMKSLHIPYWSMNGNQHEVYRDSLMLN